MQPKRKKRKKKGTPRLDVLAAQNVGPSHGAKEPAILSTLLGSLCLVAWCVCCRAVTCHAPACRTATNAARFCLSRSPLTLRDRNCREGGLGWLIEPPQGLQGALFSTLRLVCVACLSVWGLPACPSGGCQVAVAAVVGMEGLSAAMLPVAGPAAEPSDCASNPHNKWKDASPVTALTAVTMSSCSKQVQSVEGCWLSSDANLACT